MRDDTSSVLILTLISWYGHLFSYMQQMISANSQLQLQACNFHQWIDGTAISVSESLIDAKDSKEMYLRILEEMRDRRAAKRRDKEMDIHIKEMHCQMREDEVKDEEEELRRR
jgi:hypothetical protein